MEKDKLKNSDFIKRVVWFAMLMAVIIYNFVAHIIINWKEPTLVPELLIDVLVAVSILLFFTVIVVRSRFQKTGQTLKLGTEIILWAMVETIVLLGFVLSILTCEMKYIFSMTIPAVFLLVVYYPRALKPPKTF